MKNIMTATLIAFGAVFTLQAGTVSAQMMSSAVTVPPVLVRGAITAVSGTAETGWVLMIAGKARKTYKLTLAPKANVTIASVIGLDDIKPNSFIGTAAEPTKDGTLKAVEVHVFPEAMRGVGEGHRPWDTSKTSSMTNGNVGAVKTGGLKKKSGRTLTVDYQGGQKTVYVPKSVPIVMFGFGNPSQLVKGAHVFGIAKALPDGSLVSNSIVVGIDGTVPPM